MNRHVLIAALLVLATLFVFLQVRGFDFINYDDEDYIAKNPMVSGGLDSESIQWAFTAEKSATWQPLTWLSLMADVRRGELDPGVFHTTNLVFHVLNALLLYALLFAMTGAAWPAALATALFAIHPLHVESVAWVTERKDVLSTFWGLLSLLAYVRYARTRSKLYQALAGVCLALGLLAKPMLVTWPFVMLLLDWWPLRRLAPDGAPAKGGPRFVPRPLSALLVEKIPYFLLIVASSAIAYRVQSGAAATADWSTVGLGDRLANALVSTARYLGKTFWPSDFSILYPHPNMSGGTPLAGWQIGGAALLLVVITAGVLFFRRRRYLAAGWFWFLGTLVPVIGIVQIGTHAMADRFTYVPLIGVFVAIAWALRDLHGTLATRGALPRRLVPAVGIALTVALLPPARALTAKWTDSITLYEYSLESQPGSPKIHYNLGLAYSVARRLDDALPQYRKAIELQPTHERAWNNLGLALGRLGRYEEGEEAFREALRLKPDFPLAHKNYGKMLEMAGRPDEAIEQRKIALEQEPDAENANNLGVLLAKQGRFAEAIPYFQNAMRLRPGWQPAAKNLENALRAQQQNLN